MRGAIPNTPTLRLLRGQAGKAEAQSLVRPVEDAPAAPEGLSSEASAEWSRVVPELYARGVFDPVLDHAFMVVYCSAWATYIAAMSELAASGLTADGYRGQVKKSPAHQIARDSAALMVTFGARFGLNPLDRQRLHIPSQDTPDDSEISGLLS
ncbi:phage terminase small subunit P27 family [Streptomyces sp. NBC_00328]|uniref:phage terminase small subunit P27 family n=1 Tax=Streptomyces sp. NBC_00328 TaxID=2903646 RepID=UPI002E28B93D|nr:phage terminase small subunit P27 family [Streptomyces sp. NBC_00328]